MTNDTNRRKRVGEILRHWIDKLRITEDDMQQHCAMTKLAAEQFPGARPATSTLIRVAALVSARAHTCAYTPVRSPHRITTDQGTAAPQ